MDEHQIIMTPDAENDLRELRDYIADVLNVIYAKRDQLRALCQMQTEE